MITHEKYKGLPLDEQVKKLNLSDQSRPREYFTQKTVAKYTGLPPNHPDALKKIGSKTIFEPCTKARFDSFYGVKPPRSSAEKARLVRGAKSPTELPEAEKNEIRKRFEPEKTLNSDFGSELLIEEKGPKEITANGTRLVISKRDWSLEHRIRLESEASVSQQPPEQCGARKTDHLTKRSVRQILDAGVFTGTHRGGFTTFATLTFDAESRKKIEAGEITPQKEISRFLDACQKMFQRGWVPAFKATIAKKYNGKKIYCLDSETQKIQAEYWQKSYKHGDVVCVGKTEERPDLKHQKLDYIWTLEKPKNKQGEDNLHCHLLMRWDVPKSYFMAWAQRIEKIWGNGFVHLERMRVREASIDYLLKAIGYTVKGDSEKADQGQIIGNRYGISKTARAPEWEAVNSFEWGCMGYLFKMIQERIAVNRAQANNDLKATRAKLAKTKKIKANRAELHRLKVRANLAKKQLEKAYKGKNVLTVKTQAVFDQFMSWANRQGYSKNKAPSRLWLAEFRRRLRIKAEFAIYKMVTTVTNNEWFSLMRQAIRPEPEPPEFEVFEGQVFAL